MRCPECNVKFGYVRLNGKQWVCRNCGVTSEMPTVKKAIRNFTGLTKD